MTNVLSLSPLQLDRLRYVRDVAEVEGYGHLIAYLRHEWAKKLLADGIPWDKAIQATDMLPYPQEWEF